MPNPTQSSRHPVLMLNSIKFWGGGEQWFLQVAKGLSERGYEVCVAGRRDGIFLARFAGSIVSTLPLRMSSDYGLSDIRALRGWLKCHAGTTVFCNLSREIRLVRLASLGLPDVRVVWVMGSILIRQRWRDRYWVRQSVDRILVPSESLAEELTGLDYIPRSLVSVVPIGIDLSGWSPQPARSEAHLEHGECVVGVFGRLEERKGHRYLIEGWSKVLARIPDAKLWILGTGSAEPEFRALTVKIGLDDSIRFCGFQSDIRSVIASVDLVVQPSLYEPFGIILLEAMACGKPIVCTTAGGMREVVDADCARTVPPGDSVALADAVVRVLSDHSLAIRMGAAGRRRVEEKFGLSRMIDRVESVIGDVWR